MKDFKTQLAEALKQYFNAALQDIAKPNAVSMIPVEHIGQATAKILTLIEQSLPEPTDAHKEWLKEARENYQRNNRMFEGEADRGEVDAAIEARAIETSRNETIKEIRNNLGLGADGE